MLKFKKEKDNLGFPRGYYNRDDVVGLEVRAFTNSREWLIALHRREEEHCLISPFVWGRLLGERKMYSAIDSVSTRSELKRGRLGTLTFGIPTLTLTTAFSLRL
jgi:hypothetical protein